MAKGFNPYAEHFGEQGRGVHDSSIPPTCRYCNKAGLQWEDDNGKWVLIDSHTYEVHKCLGKKQIDVGKLLGSKL